jgi:putative ATP-dependent endonuclease of OLD family
MADVTGPRLKQLRIKNYRSIEGWIDIALPTGAPLVLIGENNAGKSNIVRALTLVLGETWPGNHNPDDHEFFGRSPEGIEMRVHVEVEGLACPKGCSGSTVQRFIWKYCKEDDRPCEFSFEASNCEHTYMSNALRGQLACMTVGVDRDLSWQLSYGSKWTTLSKLMRRFHSHLVEDADRVTKLKGFYSGLVETFYEVDEFKEFADSLKRATEDFGGNLPYGLDIDFSAYDASNFFRSMRVYPHLDGEARAYEELGTGQEQVLAMAFTYAYAKAFGGDGLVLVVEEPEAHLHPLAQQWVAGKLQDLAGDGVQVILTTHSPYFVDLSRPGTTVLVRKLGEGHASQVIQLKPSDLASAVMEMGAPETVTPSNIGPFYENSATTAIKAGLFARACVLVEGPTEELALVELLRRLGCDLVRLGIALIPVGGITNLAKWVRYFRAHDLTVYPIFDSDSAKSGSEAERAKAARADLFGALGLEGDRDWYDRVAGPVGVHPDFAVMDADFETALRAAFGQEYIDLEGKGRESLGNAKPLIARYVARSLSDPSVASNGWDSLRPLAERLDQLVGKEDESGDYEGRG